MAIVLLSLSEIYLPELNLTLSTGESFAKVRDILAVYLASLVLPTNREVYKCFRKLRGGDYLTCEEHE